MSDCSVKLMPPSLEPWSPTAPPEKRMAVLMSGGVDSSTTAHLLEQRGFEVVGITMKIPIACDNSARGCCGADAALVCHEMGLPHYFVDVTEAFNKHIIERFRADYAAARTPNPCVDCNSLLKFSLVWDLLEAELDVPNVATGHYARIIRDDDRAYLARAADKTKDQSYFLYGTPAERLDRLHLPLGEMTKDRVRALASELDLSVAEKAESMELCFAGEGDYRAALSEDQADREGDLTDMDGNKIGTHRGISNYTLGQRKGLGFAGGVPLYVGRIDPKTNTVALGTREQVSSSDITANESNVLIPDQLREDARVSAKIRSYGDPRPCTITDFSDNRLTVRFDKPQFAPTPGQKLVLYNQKDQIIAGGTITQP